MRNILLRTFIGCWAMGFATAAWAQFTEGSQPNLVPNPSFEEFDGFPIGWYYKGEDFDYVMKYWSSATTASPDAYGPRVRVPASWAEKGFGKQSPRTGQAMAGITMYGCSNGKPHCREYIQIQLREPLVVGQTYVVEMWVASLRDGLNINGLGVHFTSKKTTLIGEGTLELPPTEFVRDVIVPKAGEWEKVSLRVVAQAESDWVVIGNFFDDERTAVLARTPSNLNFAYYYIDDVSVRKTEPFLPVPVKDDDLTRIPLELGKTVLLKNIYFDSDKAELLPRSNVELDKLLQVMRDNPTLEIEIIGHTDNTGSPTYNQTLSRQRAEQVADYLIRNGIRAERMHTAGFGSAQPIASNDAEETRQMNRRVEFRILKK